MTVLTLQCMLVTCMQAPNVSLGFALFFKVMFKMIITVLESSRSLVPQQILLVRICTVEPIM